MSRYSMKIGLKMLIVSIFVLGVSAIMQSAVVAHEGCHSDWVDVIFDPSDRVLRSDPPLMNLTGNTLRFYARPTVSVLDVGIHISIGDRHLRSIDNRGLWGTEEVFVRYEYRSSDSSYNYTHVDLELCASGGGGCSRHHLDGNESFFRTLWFDVFAAWGGGFYEWCWYWQ